MLIIISTVTLVGRREYFSRNVVREYVVLGANDVVNPSAREEEGSPIYGMPILNVDRATQVLVIKRSLNPGFAGIDNPLFYNDNTMMVFGDAKGTALGIAEALRQI